MWKLVKSEVTYLARVVLYSYALYIAICLIAVILQSRQFRASVDYGICDYWSDPGPSILVSIAITHLIVNFALLYLEVRESRTRLVCRLPVPMVRIGFARILTPLTILGIYILLAVVCVAILLTPMIITAQVFGIGVFSDVAEASPLTIVGDLILLVLLWTVITYAFRLLSEWPGRVLLMIYVAGVIAHGVVLSFFKPRLASYIANILYDAFTPPQGIVLSLLLAIALCCFLQVSFMRRRSFLS